MTMLLALLGCAVEPTPEVVPTPPTPVHPTQTTLVALLADPQAWDGRRVRVAGVLHHKLEDSGLFLTREHADHLLMSYAVWVALDGGTRYVVPHQPQLLQTNPRLDGEWVMVTGIFDASDRGHLRAYGGTLREVERVQGMRRWYDGAESLVRPPVVTAGPAED